MVLFVGYERFKVSSHNRFLTYYYCSMHDVLLL